MRIQQILRNQMRNDARRHEMGANGNVRIELTDKLHQRPGVQTVQHEPHSVGFPWFITLLVPPPEEVRGVLHQASVKLRVEIPKQLIRKAKRIRVQNFVYSRVLLENFRKCLASTNVSGSCAG